MASAGATRGARGLRDTRRIMATISDNIQQVRDRIAAACAAAQRPVQSVTLLAVAKTFGAADVRAAFAAGQRAFGENYVQEAIDKMEALADLRAACEWHLIGPLQGNKTRVVAERFDWVQSVDRLRIAQRLSEQRPAMLPPLQVCLQVNVSGEASKSGVAPTETRSLAQAVAALPRVRLRGLMAIPEPAADLASQRRPQMADAKEEMLAADEGREDPVETEHALDQAEYALTQAVYRLLGREARMPRG